jgi:hypothetical protein
MGEYNSCIEFGFAVSAGDGTLALVRVLMVVGPQGLDRSHSEREGLFAIGCELVLPGFTVVGQDAEVRVQSGEPIDRIPLQGCCGQVRESLWVTGG